LALKITLYKFNRVVAYLKSHKIAKVIGKKRKIEEISFKKISTDIEDNKKSFIFGNFYLFACILFIFVTKPKVRPE